MADTRLFGTKSVGNHQKAWSFQTDYGVDYLANGHDNRYENKTHVTDRDTHQINLANLEAPQLQFTVEDDQPTAVTPTFTTQTFTTSTTTADTGMWNGNYTTGTSANSTYDFTLRGQWLQGGNFMTDEDQMLGNRWFNPSYEHNSKLEALFERLTDKEKEKLEEYQLERYDAKLKSEKLLKMMLSAKEYNALKTKGEMEIEDPRDSNVIFIVKKESHAMIERKVNGKYKDRHCIVPNPIHKLPIGDEILQKVLLLKAMPEEFEKIAIVHT